MLREECATRLVPLAVVAALVPARPLPVVRALSVATRLATTITPLVLGAAAAVRGERWTAGQAAHTAHGRASALASALPRAFRLRLDRLNGHGAESEEISHQTHDRREDVILRLLLDGQLVERTHAWVRLRLGILRLAVRPALGLFLGEPVVMRRGRRRGRMLEQEPHAGDRALA